MVMRIHRVPATIAAASLLIVLLHFTSPPGAAAPDDRAATTDPLAAEVERWSAYLRGNPDRGDEWEQMKRGMEPAMARVESALRDGRRLLALERLAAVRMNLAGFEYASGIPADRRADPAGLEAEWARVGTLLRSDAGATTAALDGVQPAAVRAEAEAALPQATIYYDSSLEYGRATEPFSGFFYLGVARAQRDFVAFCRSLAAPTALKAPPVRPIAAEIEALESDLLQAYRPPASIDRHPEFIVASAALKEARELDQAGLRYGALLRYLQAAMRVRTLRSGIPADDPAAVAKRLEEIAVRLASGGVDHSIGRLYLETAQASSGDGPGANPAFASAIASDVLPRYFAALGPAPAPAPKPEPKVTVTLVRWPYT